MVKAMNGAQNKIEWIIVDDFFYILFAARTVSDFQTGFYFEIRMFKFFLYPGDFFKIAVQPGGMENRYFFTVHNYEIIFFSSYRIQLNMGGETNFRQT